MKNVLITGAAGNLGHAVVEKFMKEGYKILATVDPKGEHHLKDGVQAYAADLMNESQVNETITKVVADNKTIDAALLLVGGYAGGNIHETDGNALRKMMSLNFETAYFVARPVFQQMMKQGNGRIVFVASKTALLPEPGKNNVGYSLSKFLLTKLAELLNAEGASNNVVCSVVAPGTIDTEANRKAMPKADFSKWVKPEDIAEAMFFLAGDRGSILREPILKVYGGS